MGSNEGFFFHAEYNEPNNERMAITPAGDMQASRLCCCWGKLYSPVCRLNYDGSECKDRLSACSSMGLPYGGDVCLPVRCRTGEAQACLVADLIDGLQAERWGLGQAGPESELDAEVAKLAQRMVTIPRNQLVMQKLMVNQVLENMGFASSQVLATLFDGIARHSPEGINFKKRAETFGWKQAVQDCDRGSFDWTKNIPFTKKKVEI